MLRLLYESLGAAVLLTAAAFALASVRRDSGRLSLVAGVGTLFLTLDEVLGGHEHLGRLVYEDFGWGDPPLVNHWDDVIALGIGVFGLLAVVWLRAEVREWRPFALWFGAGLALFAAALAWDGTVNPSTSASWYTEETLELVGAAAMAIAFALRFGRLSAHPKPL